MASVEHPEPPRGLAEHVAINRRHWDAMADERVAGGERWWATT